MQPLSEAKRKEILQLLEKKIPYRQIQEETGVSLGSISKIRRNMTNKPVKSVGGRPRKLTARNIRKICRVADKEKIDNAVQIASVIKPQLNIQVSDQTTRRALRSSGYKAVKKAKKPLLSARHKKQRLDFAQTHAEWTVEDWKRVIFSDETKVNRICSDGIQWCWQKEGRTKESKIMKPVVKFGGGNIMVWGCITAEGTGYITQIEGNMDQHLYKHILETELEDTIEFYDFNKDEIIFQHDNDPKHTSKTVKKWLNDNDFIVLSWPAQSPDLNPIENIWQQVKAALQKYDKHPTSVAELWSRFQVEWDKITKERCLALYESMPRRIAAVIRAKGGSTKY